MSAYNPQPSIAWESVEQAFIDWAHQITGLEAIWANENGPQPGRAFVTLDWLTYPSAIGEDYYDETDDEETLELERVLEGVRAAVVTVQVFSSSTRAGENAAYYADLLANSLNSDTVTREHFMPVRMAFWSAEDIRPGDLAEDKKYISRAAFDARFGFSAGTGEVVERVPYITTVAIDGTFATPSQEYAITASITSGD